MAKLHSFGLSFVIITVVLNAYCTSADKDGLDSNQSNQRSTSGFYSPTLTGKKQKPFGSDDNLLANKGKLYNRTPNTESTGNTNTERSAGNPNLEKSTGRSRHFNEGQLTTNYHYGGYPYLHSVHDPGIHHDADGGKGGCLWPADDSSTTYPVLKSSAYDWKGGCLLPSDDSSTTYPVLKSSAYNRNLGCLLPADDSSATYPVLKSRGYNQRKNLQARNMQSPPRPYPVIYVQSSTPGTYPAFYPQSSVPGSYPTLYLQPIYETNPDISQ